MFDIVVDGQPYSVAQKLDVFTQLHVARKLGPSLPILEGLIVPENANKDKSILAVLMLSHIADADCEFVIRKCLSVVMRGQSDGRMVKLQAPDGSLMFSDLTMDGMLTLTLAVIEENLGDFFRIALGSMAGREKALV